MTGFPRTALIGGGIMGEAICRALLAARVTTPDQVAVSDPLPARCEFFRHELGTHATTRNVEAVERAELVILSIKPQNARDVLHELKAVTGEKTLFISIMAGVPLHAMSAALQRGANDGDH